ncbi:hypothetical protein [Flavobacterium sp. B17]|uniref:hypothetical protein n=1 Tax=Flavobacterium sp. B17 TaxID=95618 RepID=UPI000344F27D|nr:hypothetical protein [Flavobacterium sp. B17]
MKKKLLLLLTLASFSFVFSQEIKTAKTMGFYFNPSLNLGLKLIKKRKFLTTRSTSIPSLQGNSPTE